MIFSIITFSVTILSIMTHFHNTFSASNCYKND